MVFPPALSMHWFKFKSYQILFWNAIETYKGAYETVFSRNSHIIHFKYIS